MVCQLVEGVGRLWLRWDFRWADWRLTDKKGHKLCELTRGSEKGNKTSRDTEVYRGTVSSYNAGEDLGLGSRGLCVLTILLSNLRRKTKIRAFLIQTFLFRWRQSSCGKQKLLSIKEILPCFVSQSPLEDWWKEAQTGLGSLSWWLCCLLVSLPLPLTTRGEPTLKTIMEDSVCVYANKTNIRDSLFVSTLVHQRADCSFKSRMFPPAMQRGERGGWERLRRRENTKGEASPSHWWKTASLIVFMCEGLIAAALLHLVLTAGTALSAHQIWSVSPKTTRKGTQSLTVC